MNKKESLFIPIAEPEIGMNEKIYIQDCIETGWVSSAGQYISKFEKINQSYHDMKYGVAVSNGTVALHLALVALGIKSDDEVLIPNLTFAATANAVNYIGAKPVLIDIDKLSWTIDLEKAEALVNKKTKAIIPVHLYGQPCDMDAVMNFAKKHDLFVIEDCAEAYGAEFKDKKIGSFGHINCFSFYANKIITCGEGGICLTNDKNLSDKMRILMNHGMNKKNRYWHDIIGFNYRMTNMQAALGYGQAQRIDDIIDKRSKIQEKYDQKLSNNNLLTLQVNLQHRKKVCWLYSILINTKIVDKKIEEIQSKLLEKGIDSRPFFFPLNTMPPYSNLKTTIQSNSLSLSQKGLSLPTFERISDEQISYVCKNLLDTLKN